MKRRHPSRQRGRRSNSRVSRRNGQRVRPIRTRPLSLEALEPRRLLALVDVMVQVTYYQEISQPDGGLFDPAPGDYYAKITINGVETPKTSEITGYIDCGGGRYGVAPRDWKRVVQVDSEDGNVPIKIEIWDDDDFSDDEHMDINPLDDQKDVVLELDPVTGSFSGPGIPEGQEFSVGDGGMVYFLVSGLDPSGDADGDGLLNGWEANGVLVGGMYATTFLDLPAWGADPFHKDLFLEMDWMQGYAPDPAVLQEIVDAFAAAPADAGTHASEISWGRAGSQGVDAAPNPDGLPGINLHIDSGQLRDLVTPLDGSDPFYVPGGNEVPLRTDIAGLNWSFASVKFLNFHDWRSLVFRYCLLSPYARNNTGISTTDATTGPNTATTLIDRTQAWTLGQWAGRTVRITGGTGAGQSGQIVSNTATQLTLAQPWSVPGAPPAPPVIPDNTSTYAIDLPSGVGELGGNDFVCFEHDAGTIMHEFGHTLNLHHGGDDATNHKPNYLSVMNYFFQFGGIPQNAIPFGNPGFVGVIDYSPPSRPDGTRVVLPLLVENNLDETQPLDPDDPQNWSIFQTGAGPGARVVQFPLNGQDRDNNGTLDGPDWYVNPNPTIVVDPLPVTADINGGDEDPGDDIMDNDTLDGHDDWSRISLPFRQFAGSAAGVLMPEPTDDPTLEQMQEFFDALNNVDLEITKTDAPDPVKLGSQLVYTLSVTNKGPNYANGVRVVDTLPAGVTFVSATASQGTVSNTPQNVTCDVGTMGPGQTETIEITVVVSAVGKLINTAEVTTDSTDVDETNNTVTETTMGSDRFEPNDTLATATVLGSEPAITLRELSIHPQDKDFFQITARDTGKLVINAFLVDEDGNLNVRVRDEDGNNITPSGQGNSTTDDEQIVIPVVSQEQYFLEVFGVGEDTNVYQLEIENFAAPVPDAVVLDPLDDTGWSSSDNVTSEAEARIFIEADLFEFALEGIDILSPTEVADQEDGAAVEVFVNGNSVGYATPIPGTGDTLFEYTFEPGELSTTFIPARGGGGLNFVKAAVRMFDGQEDEEGDPDPEDARTQLSEPLLLTLDPTAPDASVPDMLDSSDSGNRNDDDVTNVTQPAFQGIAEAGAIVRVFANDVQVGQGVVGSDLTDGAYDQMGRWEVTIEPLVDGEYTITTEIEDLAGNISEPLEEGLPIWIDTIAPNTPYLDLVGLEGPGIPLAAGPSLIREVSDTGRHDSDNITFDNTPTVTVVADDTIDGDGNPFWHDVKYRIYDRPDPSQFGGGANNGEVLLVESWTGIPGFSEDGFFIHTLSQLLNDDYNGTIDGTPLADGVHNLKLEVEDRAGNFSHDFLLQVTIDTVAPPVSIGLAGNTIDGIDPATTDTGIEDQPGTFTDRITSDTGTGFWGRAEADAVVRLFVDNTNDDAIGNTAEYGVTVAVPADGNQTFPNGQWRTAFIRDLNDPDFFPLDGLREVAATAEDLAGNVSEPDFLDIFIDTRGPQVEEVNITGEEDYDLFNPKGGDHPEEGPTPLVWSLDIDLIDRPVRGEEGTFEGAGFVDLVFIVDESGSMGGEHDFLQTFVPGLEAGLVANGVGNGALGVNQYALVGFGDDSIIAGHTYNVGAGLMGTAAEFVTSAATNLLLDGGTEDGYSGINEALAALPLRPGAETLFVLVSDEDRDDWDGSTYANVLAALTAEDVTLHAILDVSLEDGVGNTALAVDFDGVAYLEEPGGLFSTAGGGVVTGGFGTTVADYVDLSFDTEGIVADLNQLRLGGDTAASFAAALADGLISSVVGGFVYPAANEILATTPGNIQIVGDANGIIPIESIDFLDYTVAGDVGRTTIRLNFFDPLPDDRFTLTVSDRIKDDPGNALDGESNTAEPQDDPFLPSGDGDPGEDFVARFTVDSRPEIGTWSAGSVYVDTNGNFYFDPQNLDYTNRDLVYVLGFTTDYIFAGNFALKANDTADGFDKLAAYGKVGGQARWMVDTDNDGVPNVVKDDPANIIGHPFAGNFDVVDPTDPNDPGLLNGDEVGLYDGTTWFLDANHNFRVTDPGDIRISIPGMRLGYPIVGDFDGDGFDDLATFQGADSSTAPTGVFTIALSTGVVGGYGIPTQIRLNFQNFIGVRERPVAADMNQDGIDDLGLWVPDRSGATPWEGGEWYFWISDTSLQENGSVAPLNHAFSPYPLGDDLFAQFGDEFAVPIVGNFDPPVAGEGVASDPAVLSLLGTPGDDVLEFTAGSTPGSWTLVLNGVAQDAASGSAITVEFDGLEGKDTVIVTGTSGVDTAKLWPHHGKVVGEGYTVVFDNVDSVRVHGGGGEDVADLRDDPAGKDTYHAWPDQAKLFGEGFINRVVSFPWVHAFSTAGNQDMAVLHDDPNGVDTFKLWPEQAKLYGDGFFTRAKGFWQVHAFSSPGNDDVAVLYDNPNATDTFKFWPGEAKLYGDGFYNRAKGFSQVHAFSSPGNDDVAVLYDDPDGAETFKAWPEQAKLYGDGFFNRAKGFRWVHAYATGGNDVAHLYGSAAKDTLKATSVQTSLFGPEYFNRAVSFDRVYAHGGDELDAAILYDAVLETGIAPVPAGVESILWLYEFEDLQQRNAGEDDDSETEAVDELFTAYWE